MQITKPTKAEVMRELKDYVFITFGLISYAMGWAYDAELLADVHS